MSSASAASDNPRDRIAQLERDLAAARASDDREAEGNTLNELGHAYYSLGDARKAITCYKRAFAIYRETGDRRRERTAQVAWRHGLWRTILLQTGNRRDEGLALTKLGNACYTLGGACVDLGDTREAIRYYKQALAIFRKTNSCLKEESALTSLGDAYYTLGDARKAIIYHEQALAITRENPIRGRVGEGIALINLGFAYYQLGDRSHAIGLMSDALAIYIAIHSPDADAIRAKLREWGAVPDAPRQGFLSRLLRRR